MSYELLKKFKNWDFRRKNGYPSADEVRELMAKTPLKNLTILGYAVTYCTTNSVDITADAHKVSRERIKQCLMKLYRSCHVVDRDL